MKKILVMGLPGSGKTTLAQALTQSLIDTGAIVSHLNADEIRQMYDDWDFSPEGRIRQATRMEFLANELSADYVIADFVAPLPAMREIFKADYVVWMDTITEGRYADTNSMFVPPDHYDLLIHSKDAELWARIIIHSLLAHTA